jgi:uncharacterized Fe-S cluster protein YjdI
VAPLGTLVVLGARLLWASKLFQRQKKGLDETVDDVPWVLTITRVALEYWDTVEPTRLCRGAWQMSMLNNVTKKHMRKCVRGRGSLANLHSTRWVMPHHRFLGIASSEMKGCALPSESWVCWLFLLVS